jgi:hypothetical protein
MTYSRSLPMSMLPNDSHPGPGCSCSDCLRTYPTEPPKRVALCDCCDERPGVRTVVAFGIETWVCDPCSGETDPDPYGEMAEARDEAKAERDSYTTQNSIDWSRS